MILTPNTLARIVRAAAAARPDELDCDECFERLGRFAEMRLAGRSAVEAMPLVEAHLKTCRDCREEFEALLEAMRAAEGRDPFRN